MIQRTDGWFTARMGKITSSRIAHFMAKETTAEYQNAITELVLERMTGQRQESFTNAAMQWGTDHEDEARAIYEAESGVLVDEVGLIVHPENEWFACSPDGLVMDGGMLEIKCPNSTTHITTLRTGAIDNKYLFQMNWQMFCTGRRWCDYMSYDPRMPEKNRVFIKRVEFNEVVCSEMEQVALKALEKIESTIKFLEAM